MKSFKFVQYHSDGKNHNSKSRQFKSGWFWRCRTKVDAFTMQLLDGYVSTKLNDSKHTYKSEHFVQSKSEWLSLCHVLESRPCYFKYIIVQSIMPRAGNKNVMRRKMKMLRVLFLLRIRNDGYVSGSLDLWMTCHSRYPPVSCCT